MQEAHISRSLYALPGRVVVLDTNSTYRNMSSVLPMNSSKNWPVVDMND